MRKTFAERFWYRVKKTDTCWIWIGGKDTKGYGCYSRENGGRAHIVAYANLVEPVPKGMCVLHRCDNPSCVRPDHLFLGTKDDNNKDRHAKGRTSHVGRNPGSAHGMSKLDEQKVKDILVLRRSGMGLREIAACFGVSKSVISLVALRKRWQHVEA